jgi:hypothetical protein
MNTMLDALKLIAGRSTDAMREALKAIQAVNAGSPVVQQRYNQVAEIALNDASAEFTAEEKLAIIEHIDQVGSVGREFVLHVRLTDSERDELQLAADAAGTNMSGYARRMLFPSER